MTNNPKILIIDDEESIRSSFVAHFEDYNYIISTADNGLIGIELIKKELPDIILTDMRMPEMGGIGVLKWLQENNLNVPIIIVSGAGDINLVVDALRLGAWDYILKPVQNLSILTHAVEKALEKSFLIKENINYRNHLEELVRQRTEQLNLANSALLEEERKYKILADNLSDIIWNMDIDFTLNYVSPSVYNITGYSVDEYMKLNNEQRFTSASIQKFSEHFNHYSHDEQNTPSDSNGKNKIEIELKCKNGTIILVESTVKLLYGGNGSNKSFVGSMRDITQRKHAEEELKIAKEKAEESDRLKTTFLNNISHEIRTPLNVIQGYAGLLSNDYCDDENIKELAEPILRNSKQLLKIIKDILDVSIIESGKTSLNLSSLNLNTIVIETVNEQKINAETKNLELKIGSLLNENESVIITDEVKLKQVLNNIVLNGIKYSLAGYVKIDLKRIGNEVLFSIKDTGKGIDAKNFSIIFERFQRLEQESTSSYHSITHGGTGLGLSISKEFLNLMGGKIWLDSKIGMGTTFYFTLPINQ